MSRRLPFSLSVATFLATLLSIPCQAQPVLGPEEPVTCRLYEAAGFLIDDPAGTGFDLTVTVRDINHIARGPSELMVKVYDPAGGLCVRDVIPDDGVTARTYAPAVAGWDHEAWYYATCYSRGLEPAVRFSALTDPARVNQIHARSFTFRLEPGQPGGYRVLLAGSPDLIVSLTASREMGYAVMGAPEWLHGRGDQYARRHVYVPKGATGISLQLLEMEMPFGRVARILGPDGAELLATAGDRMISGGRFTFPDPKAFAEQILTLEVGPGSHDYLLQATIFFPKEQRNVRGPLPWVFAALAPDPETARRLRNGAIDHDGQTFWQSYAVRLYDIMKQVPADQKALPAGLPAVEGYISPGSHESPKPGAADRILHDYPAHKDPRALQAALADMVEGMRLIGPMDQVLHGGNLAYEMGTYSYFYQRPAWRLLQQIDCPEPVRETLRDFMICVGDRLAFCRGVGLVNGNSLASLLQGMAYCVKATEDPLQQQLFDTYWDRFTTGGFGPRIGVGPSGGVQESFGYDYHYGGYVLRGWRAGLQDLDDPRFQKVYDGLLDLNSTVFTAEGLAVWSSRTSAKLPGGAYTPDNPRFRFKGFGGPDITGSVKDADEWFYARRPGYYIVTYHGRLTPTWMGEGFHGQIGFGGGAICQITIPSRGLVLGSSLAGSYGSGSHSSRWPALHVHSLVGVTRDGRPFIAANSEPENTLVGNTVTSRGEVRESSIRYVREYTYEPDAIQVSVRLARSGVDPIFALYGGMPGHRGTLAECHEMIPFLPQAVGRGKTPPNPVSLVHAETGELAPATSTRTAARSIVIDRGGYGVVIALDEPRPVALGANRTVLVTLCETNTPAEEISLAYTIRPFVGQPDISGKPARLDPLPMVALPADVALDDVPTLLAGAAPVPIGTGTAHVGEVRVGLAGDMLAVLATLQDAKPTPHATAWRGSCLEVFGSVRGSSEIGQVFLVPAAGDEPAKATGVKPWQESPMARARVASTPASGGYALRALIPLEALKATPVDGMLLLEFQATGADASGRMRPAVNAFGSKRAYEFNNAYGLFGEQHETRQETPHETPQETPDAK